MPEVIVRKQLKKRSGDWRYRLSRWYYRYRPQVALAVAFLAAMVIGLSVAALSLASLGESPADSEPPPAIS